MTSVTIVTCHVSRRSLPGSTAGVEDSVFAPDWLLAQLAEYFSPWLPPAQLQAFTQEAAYTFSWRPGFRVSRLIISANEC